jgi:hypothetical protein
MPMSVVCSEPPLVTASVPDSISTELPTVNDPPLIVTPPWSQLHSERVPPIVPILPPLLAPVRISVPPSSSIEPAPENAPENVVVLLAAMVSRVVGSVGPMTTVPPPEIPSASEPIWAATPPSAIVSVAPRLTATAVWPGSAVLDAATSVPALIVVAPV